MANRYSGYPASFVHAGGTLDIKQLLNLQASTDVSRLLVRAPGGLEPDAYVNGRANPRVALSTQALSASLTSISLTAGLACTSGATFRFQKRLDDGAGFDATTNLVHVVTSSGKGFLWVDSITAGDGQNQEAALSLVYAPVSTDGFANPLTVAENQAINTAPVPVFQDTFFLGPVYFGAASQVAGLQRWAYRPGLNVVPKYADGAVFPIGLQVISRTPEIDLTFLKVDMVKSSWSHIFSELTSAAPFELYLRKGSQTLDSGRIAKATALNIKIAHTDINWGPDSFGFSGEDDATVTVTVRPIVPASLSITSTVP